MGKPQHTIVDEDIHEAALWRLAGFPAEVIEASTARVAQLVKSSVPLESDQPAVAAAMAALKRPGDRRGEWTVRIKRASDLEVAAHEIGHLLDDRVPAISNAWRSNNKALREELKSISYDQSKVSEGYAEGVRLFLTQPDVLQAKAPAVHAWLENFTKRLRQRR